jgi:hypothetical protein
LLKISPLFENPLPDHFSMILIAVISFRMKRLQPMVGGRVKNETRGKGGAV